MGAINRSLRHTPHRLIEHLSYDAAMARQPGKGHAALRRGRISLTAHVYLITAATHERKARFADFATACAASASFARTTTIDGNHMLAWVLMPDHAHWLVQLRHGASLSVLVNRLKATSARAVNRRSGGNGAVWARSYHDRTLRDEDDIVGAARYIIANPIRAGLVARVGDYPFWDAIWLHAE